MTLIGITAGSIWELLDHYDEVDLTTLCSQLSQPRDVILLSLGWLVREGYVGVRQTKEKCRLFLRSTKFGQM